MSFDVQLPVATFTSPGYKSVADPGEGPPLFLFQTEAWRAEKFFETAPPPSQGLDDPPPPLIWRSGSAAAIEL